MIKRFQNDFENRKLQEALTRQTIVGNDAVLAKRLAEAVELVVIAKGETLITQDSFSSDMFFIVAGAFDILKNGRERAVRKVGQHIGDMSMIDVSAPRSATVIAKEPSLVARISEEDFTEIAKDHGSLWRSIAIELGCRLREVNRHIEKKNEIPKFFIGSSTEAIKLANSFAERFFTLLAMSV